MAYTVSYTKSALKSFAALPNDASAALRDAVRRFAADPLTETVDIKKLKDPQGLWRIRCGSFRVIFRIAGGRLDVLSAKNRKDAY